MKAVSRVANYLLGAALALAPVVAAAQQTTPTSNTASPDTVGPRELRNFSLPGTVTRPADEPATNAPAPEQPATAAPRTRSSEPPPETRTREPATPPPQDRAPPERAAGTVARTEAPVPTTTAAPPSIPAPAGDSPVVTPQPQTSFPPAPDTPAAAPDRSGVPLYVWLIAALVLGAGGAFLFRRSRDREALAGGPQIQEFAAPEPEIPVTRKPPPVQPTPAPAPAPAPQPASQSAAPSGIVSTRLRPWLKIGFIPARCTLDEQQASIDFVVELFNSGSIPARDVLIGVTAFNAGPMQDQLIGNFFAQPNEHGQRVDVVPPLDSARLELQLNIPRDQLQPYELGGQQVFVPLVAFNAAYRWATGDGQTSASFLLGRATQTDKLAPFRLDSASRIFRGLAAKALPTALRR